jgi:hypothetical protein
MRYSRFTLARLLRVLVVPLMVAVPPFYWVALANQRASLSPLGRDQGIFQYVAWALSRGAVDYRDVRDVNGPLTHLVHRVLLGLGGADERTFRWLDLVLTGIAFAITGACLPGIGSRSSRSGPRWLERAGWGIAAWVVLGGQYLLYKYWDLAQRESFFDWFLLPSLCLQLVAQAPWTRGRALQGRLLALSGGLSMVPWFGKPTYALFTILQLAVLSWSEGLALPRRRAVACFGLGGAVGAASQLGFLFVSGDAAAFFRIQLADVPAMYRFIWPRSAEDILSGSAAATLAVYAVVGALVLTLLVLYGEMPSRVMTIALAPGVAFASVVAQGKGFPYHYHPVTATLSLQWLVFVAWLGERTRVTQRAKAAWRLVPALAATLLAMHVALSMPDSPHVRDTWLMWGASTPEDRESAEYFAHFPETDFYPYELRLGASYLRSHTKPEDRVQTYGMDAYLLFLARRLSATPYIYAYDLNADAALYGGTGGRPDGPQSEHIRAIRDAHEEDMLRQLQASPPAAFAFLDGAPLLSEKDAEHDFERHCRRAAGWVGEHYRETAHFGHVHVWLREDLAQREPPGQVESPP